MYVPFFVCKELMQCYFQLNLDESDTGYLPVGVIRNTVFDTFVRSL